MILCCARCAGKSSALHGMLAFCVATIPLLADRLAALSPCSWAAVPPYNKAGFSPQKAGGAKSANSGKPAAAKRVRRVTN
jgi:hypothetical protein